MTIHAWRRDAQRGRAVGPLAILAIGFAIAKIANRPLLIGNLGNWF